MKKGFFAIILAFILLLLQTTSICAKIYVSYDFEKNGLNIAVDEMLEGDFFTINFGKTTPFSKTNPPIISKMLMAENDGVSEYFIRLGSDIECGKYTLLFGAKQNEEAAVAKTVIIYDLGSDEAKDLAESINKTSTPEQLYVLLNDADKAAVLGIDIAEENYYEEALSCCSSLKSELPGEKFSPETFVATYNYAKAIVLLKKGETIDSVFKEYATCFSTTYEEFNALSEPMKNEFLALLKAEVGFISFAELEIVSKVRLCETYGELRDVLVANAASIGLDINGDYEKVTTANKYKVFTEMIKENTDYFSYKDITEGFEKGVEKALTKKVAMPERPSGSTGGGVASSKPSDERTYDVPVQNEKNETLLSDIKGHFAESSIINLFNKDILEGFPDGSFKPDAFVTRGQFCKVIAGAFNISGGEKTFEDVQKDHWAYKYITAIASKGIVKGDGINFYPDNGLTRQDAAVIIYNMLKDSGESVSGNLTFVDKDKVAFYAHDAVGGLANAGIINGFNGMYRPLDMITRGEMAVIVDRLMSR